MRRLLPVIRVLFSAIAIGTLLHFYDVSTVVQRAMSLPASTMAIAVLLFAIATLLAIVKWRLTLPSEVGFVATVRAYVVSYFYSLSPAGQVGGELGKLLTLAKHASIRTLAGSLIFDKLTGLMALCLVGLVGWTAARGPLTTLMVVLVLGITIACGAALGLAEPIARVVARLASRSRHAVRLGNAVLSIAQRLSHFARVPNLIVKSLALGVVAQAAMVALYILLARALGIAVPVPDLALLVVVANVAAVIPISLAGLGVREASLVGLLATYNVPGENAIALSLTAFAIFLLGVAAGALVELHALLHAPVKRIVPRFPRADTDSVPERRE
jgi:uncharacterized membrane protein YbhN (UPF0104 family)